jgi:hypothetical protein
MNVLATVPVDVGTPEAAAVAARPPREVKKRELRWSDEGTVIQILVPRSAKAGEYPANGMQKAGSYLQFYLPINGGVVSLFVHTDKPEDLLGQTITATPTVWVKTLAGNEGKDEQFLYIDLKPTEGPVSHKMRISGGDLPERHRNRSANTRFVTPPHPRLKGWVVFSPTGRQ